MEEPYGRIVHVRIWRGLRLRNWPELLNKVAGKPLHAGGGHDCKSFETRDQEVVKKELLRINKIDPVTGSIYAK